MKRKLYYILFLLTNLSLQAAKFSYTNEIKLNDENSYRPDGRNKWEWTVGRGYYQIENGLKLKYDVDRDFVTYNDPEDDYVGWDTYFGIEYPLKNINIFGKKITSTGSIDYYWDRSGIKEREAGVSITSRAKLTDSTSMTAKGIFRNINRVGSSYNDDGNIYGIETWFTNKLNDQWRFGFSIKGYWGGYTDGGSTFYNERDGFNYEGYVDLAYCVPIYEVGGINFDFETDFGYYWYALGKDYEETTTSYDKVFVRPGIMAVKEIGKDITMYLNVRYNVLGSYAYDNNTGKDADETEAIFGFNMKL